MSENLGKPPLHKATQYTSRVEGPLVSVVGGKLESSQCLSVVLEALSRCPLRFLGLLQAQAPSMSE